MPLVPPQGYRKINFIIRAGTAANRPSAANVVAGTTYFSTDTGDLERSNGSSWVNLLSNVALLDSANEFDGGHQTILNFDLYIKHDDSAAVQLRMFRTAGTAADWFVWIPGGTDELRLYEGGDQVVFTTSGEILPPSDNTGSVGTPSRRWSLVRGVTVTAGDVGFDNKWAFTEAEKVGIQDNGVALVDDTGAVVAFFNKDGVLTGDKIPPHNITTSEERAAIDVGDDIRDEGDNLTPETALPVPRDGE